MTHAIQLVAPNGNTLAITTAGSGKTVFLLHGFPLDSRMWQHQLPVLARSFHVVTVDFRGFGQSTCEGQAFSLSDLAEDVEFVRQHLASEQPIALIGLSMGGYVALEYWHTYSHRLAGLVLSNTKPSADNEEAKAGRQKMAADALQSGTWPAVAPMFGKLLAEKTIREDQATANLVQDMMPSVPAKTVAAALRAMAARHDFTDQLARIRVPTLVITGQFDAISSPESNRQWSQALPDARLEIIDEAGHLPPLESPQSYNSALLSFLNKVL